MKRSGPLKRTAIRRGRRRARSSSEAAASREWHDRVLAGCEAVGSRTELEPSVVQAHHVLNQQVLRRREDELELDRGTLVWDVAAGMAVTARRHARHHSRLEPITWEELEEYAPAAIAFAEDVGLRPWLERHYPYGSDQAAAGEHVRHS